MPFIKVCDALRFALDEQHSQRLDTVEKKVQLKIIKKDPSKKVIHKKVPDGAIVQ